MNLVYGTRSDKVYVPVPHISSRASYLLLRYRYEKMILDEWEVFRNAFFDTFESLVCVYCGKGGLVREIPDSTDKGMLSILATIDHIIPVSYGGSRYDPLNCLVSCYPCNNKKRDKVGASFREFVEYRIKYYGSRMSDVQISRLRGLLL
jgi:5-methylcytosine-specific restriction endonuclease McrA